MRKFIRKSATAIIAGVMLASTVIATAPAAHAAPDRVHQNAAQFTRGDQRVFKVQVVTAWGKSARIYLGARGHQWKPVRDHTVVFKVGRHTLRNNTPTTVTIKVYRNKRTLYVKRYRVEDVTVTPGDVALRAARAQKGDRYRLGATGPNAWDCSSLVRHAYRQAGKSVPRTTSAQRHAGKRVSKPRPGDIVYVKGHTALYAGNGRIVEAANPRVGVVERRNWMRGAVYIRP